MKTIQNSFAGGEVAPSLYGRTDIEAYSHSAKTIRNFEVASTGGLRKRQGTQLLWRVASSDAEAWRTVGYFYDRTRYGAILLYKKTGSALLFWRFLVPGFVGAECSTGLVSLSAAKDLGKINVKQIGDTLFFSRRGFRCVKAYVDYAGRTVNFSEMEENIPVEDAPSLATSATGFNTNPDEGFVKTSRTYGLIGVKNGVYSKISEAAQDIWLYWVAGARVEVSFTPEWQNHDYYILAYKYAGDWGVVQNFYPDASECTSAQSVKQDEGFLGSGQSGIARYLSGGARPSEAWNGNPNELASGGYHTNAIFADKVAFSLQGNAGHPILSLKLWLGGLMRREDVPDTVEATGINTAVSIALKAYPAEGEAVEIQKWESTAAYSASAQTFTIDEPKAFADGVRYEIVFTAEGNDKVIVRDMVAGVDTVVRTFYDDNIVPGSTAGVMEPIGVGDSGMDVDVVDVWEQRLVMAASERLPFTMWFSQVGDIGNFYTTRPQTTADAFSVTIPVTAASRILHTVTARWFILFTESGEYSVDSSGNAGFGFDSISIKKTSSVGAHEDIPPVVTESAILFVAADGRSVYELSYKLEQDTVVPVNRSILASHLTEGSRIKAIAYAKFPDPRLLVLLEDGGLLSMTYLPEQRVCAWSRHDFAPPLKCVDIQCPGALVEEDGLSTSSVVLLTFALPGDPSRVWIERMRAASFGEVQEAGKAKCADHCGFAPEDYPIPGTDPETSVAAEVVTLPPEGDSLPPPGSTKAVYEAVIRLCRSGSVSVRPEAGDASASSAWHTPRPQTAAGKVSLSTADAKVLPRVLHSSTGRMAISSDDGWPCEILSVLFTIEAGG